MRTELRKLSNQRRLFTGIFVRIGTKSGWQGKILETVLIKDIRDSNNKLITNHLWFNLTKGFQNIDFKEGNKIQFMARVTSYYKGYKGRRAEELGLDSYEEDFKLSFPTKIKKASG